MLKKSLSFLIVFAVMASLFTGTVAVAENAATDYFTFNDANLAQKYVDADGDSALSKITLNTDAEYTYGNAKYSGLLDLSNGNKWGTDKAYLANAGMTTDWSGYDILRIRYYSTLADAYYSIFLTDSATSDSNRYRFTVKADKVGWQIAEIDLNRMLKSGSPSLSNIQTLQIRTDNNNDSTGGTSTQVGSGATTDLKFYFDSFWLEKYENEEYISFTDDKVFDDTNWYKDDGAKSKGKLAVTTTSYFAGSGKAGKIELTNQKWGTNHADLAKLGMTTDWSEYDTLKIRFKSKIQDAYYTLFFYCTDSYAGGAQYKVKVTARNTDWNIVEIPFSQLKGKNSPSLDSIKYMQIRTDNNNDSGEQVGSGQVSGLTFYFDKIWLDKADVTAPHYFKYVHTNGEATIRGIDALIQENQVDLVIPETIRGYKVVKIDSNAFKDNKNIVNLTLPSTLKEISDNAFSNCSNLLYITMPSCEKIRGSAFYGCTSLSVINSDYAGEVVFPKNLKEIKDGAFRNANVIRTVILPESVEKLGNAFYRCVGLKNIYFPETIPQDAYKKTFVGGSTDFKTINAFGTNNSYIATYAASDDAVDNYAEDSFEKSGNRLYNYIREDSDVLVMNSSVSVEGSKVGYNARLFNVGDEDATLFGVIAVYNADGTVLKGVNFINNISVQDYEGTTLTDETVYVENVNIENNDKVRVMFWENEVSLRPVVSQNVTLALNIAE